MKTLVEICCASAEDVLEAARGGADRVELNSGMFFGGLTPSLGTLEVALAAGIPIMAMVRPRPGGFCYTDTEFRVMLRDAQRLLDHGAKGVVFGFLHENGTVDKERVKAMLEVVGGAESVFHRAIDVTPDWKSALQTLMELHVTRVLTSGQAANAPLGMDTISQMVRFAGEKIEILPGAGIRLQNARKIIEAAGCSQIHLSAGRIQVTDLSCANDRDIHFTGAVCPPEDRYEITDAEAVAAVIAAVRN
jgi:copper homeostasis protein